MGSFRAAKGRLWLVGLSLLAAFGAVNLIQGLQLAGFYPAGEVPSAVFVDLPVSKVDPRTTLAISFIISILGLSLVLGAYLWYRPRGRGLTWWELLPLLVLGLVFLAFILALAADTDRDVGLPEEDTEVEVEEPGGGDAETERPPLGTYTRIIPAAQILGLMLLMLAITAVYLLLGPLGIRRRIAAVPHQVEDRAKMEVIRSASEGMYRLKLGDDVRSVIIRCYKEMVDALEIHGLNAMPHMTARELEMEVLGRMGLSQYTLSTLRTLFERARYSRHEMTELDRSKAIEALEAVKADLEA